MMTENILSILLVSLVVDLVVGLVVGLLVGLVVGIIGLVVGIIGLVPSSIKPINIQETHRKEKERERKKELGTHRSSQLLFEGVHPLPVQIYPPIPPLYVYDASTVTGIVIPHIV